MKKSIYALLLLMLAAPVMAANVVITVVPDGSNPLIGAINYTTDANVSAFGLKVAASGCDIVDVNGYFEGDCNSTSKGFGIFLDSINGIDIDEDGTVLGWGSPVANPNSPGAEGSGIDTNVVVLGLGALYEEGYHPYPRSGTICKIRVDETCVVCVTAESTYRGGVVMESGDSVDPNVTGANDVLLGTECYAGRPDYSEWVAVGRPRCWCYPRQCHGDADGIQHPPGKFNIPPPHWVGTPDLNVLLGAWKKASSATKYVKDGQGYYLACADFDHIEHPAGKFNNPPIHRVGTPDLNILLYYWKEAHVPDANCLPGTESP